MNLEEQITAIENSDVIRFIEWYPQGDNYRPQVNMTIGLNSDEHELAELAREFKQKCLSYYNRKWIRENSPFRKKEGG